MSGAVATRGQSKRYGRDIALESVNLEVPEGAVYLLAGRNGAGKSTTLGVLTNLTLADAGTAEILGLDTVIKNAGIGRSNTSHTRKGRGPGFAGRLRPNTSRTFISSRASGKR